MLCTTNKWRFHVNGGFYMCCSKRPVSFRQRALDAGCIRNVHQHHQTLQFKTKQCHLKVV